MAIYLGGDFLNMFDKIISYSNFEAAYLEIIEQFATDRRNFRYHGLDNIFLHDLDLKSRETIKLAQKELLQKKEIEPALSIKIPKKNKPAEYREIFIYNLKERIKAQAIYRILLPEFESKFSARLFSYRPDKPPYLAAKYFCRRYRQEFSNDQALIIDLKNYSDRIDKNLMYAQLKKIFSDQKILDILRLFIFNTIYRSGELQKLPQGLVQGVPLIALFANLYLTDLDFKYQNQAAFYIRVGDDLAFLDPDQNKLQAISCELTIDLKTRGLEINQKKLFLGAARDKFSFLGYAFKAGIIGLEPAFIERIESEWKNILVYQHFTDYAKKNIIKRIMRGPDSNFNSQFIKIIKDKPQINDSAQVKKISEDFFAILTKFFYKRYSPRNRRLLTDRLKDFSIVSLYNMYKKFHYDKR